MKKRFLSLLCVLALCLGLLPVTALAAAPIGQVLYVGGVQISSTGYWTTDSDGNVTASTAGETPTDNYISYDAENNVLTLHNATIKNELEFNESIEGGTFISGSAIGVFNKSGNAELTISLVGTNTIANVGKGIFVLASSASTGSSNLTIQGDGSLNASASQTGIWVQSNGNNAALCVENAEVTASPDGAVKNGVLVQAKDGSDVSLTVNGGTITIENLAGNPVVNTAYTLNAPAVYAKDDLTHALTIDRDYTMEWQYAQDGNTWQTVTGTAATLTDAVFENTSAAYRVVIRPAAGANYTMPSSIVVELKPSTTAEPTITELTADKDTYFESEQVILTAKVTGENTGAFADVYKRQVWAWA